MTSTLPQLKHHIESLHDIRDVMAALKNISFTETQRLRRYIDHQGRAVDSIEQAIGDFLGHYPLAAPDPAHATPLYLLIGSERGFCGDFNEALLARFETLAQAAPSGYAVLAVGEKLQLKLQDRFTIDTALAGPATVEEVPAVITAVVEKLRELHARHEQAALTLVHHHHSMQGPALRARQPLRDLAPNRRPRGHAPLLNLPPEQFFREALEQYLFAVLHAAFYDSLAAEHQQRLQHLDGATRHIDRRCAELTRRYQGLRKESITEEIELIMLSAGMLSPP